MAINIGKAFGIAPLFDPAEGMLVRAPLSGGPGWWAGAPGATYDAETGTFYLVYRLRQPRELGRGMEARIAASDNGIAFQDIWALPKTSLDALSVERCSLVRGLDGRWRLYLGYVSAEDRRWRISLLEADEPDQFDLNGLMSVLRAPEIGAEGVKDPNVFLIGRMSYMLFSYATSEPDLSPQAQEARHADGDIYNTGLTRSRTGAAISGDGRHFQWIGDVSPSSAQPFYNPAQPAGSALEARYESAAPALQPWDAYCRRITALLPLDVGGFLAFYDGGSSVSENYEEQTGLAMTFDLRTYHTLTPGEAALRSPFASGSLRYVDVLPVGHELFYYYEIARADGSHELRVNVVERD
jgi:hypothetical protein